MPTLSQCPFCPYRFWLEDDFADRTMNCPGCLQVLDMTDPATVPRPVPPTGPSWLTREWWRSLFAPPEHELDPSVVATTRWFFDYTPSDRPGAYAVAAAYAETRYKELVELAAEIEEKADDLMRTASVLGGGIVAAAKYLDGQSADQNLKYARGFVIAAFVVFEVLSIAVAATMKSRTALITPTPVRDLLRVIDRGEPEVAKELAEAIATASIHHATIGMQILISWRTRQLRRATALFCVGMATLVVLAFLI
jgi:hypothetical protein